ncbi:U3 small nucleolar RNA-associated protein 14 homolog A [Syngnathoides biaculeatus]|uniref:U3 small nucleolar RNA-associated protein 14 homolog A n=1 Tax=Syngnathoides biaculeatus TaxID=300417 RepID=UPI002ADE85D9|nr:U3 small nucleolar RNA-associated protein 14 homolog A [Syngnathoides biaculeatus]
MSKASTKKRTMKARKKRPTVPVENPDVSYDFEEDGFDKADDSIASDGEEDSDNERKRQKLVEAISSLGGARRKKITGERSEPALQKSEFTVNAEGEGVKIKLTDLMKSMDKISAVSAKAKKQLKKLHQSKKTVECPVTTQERERIQRDVAFQKVAKEVTQWQSVIQKNHKAEQLVFPLNQEPPGPKAVERVVMSWKAQTPLEQEIFSLLSANNQPTTDPILTPTEEASMKAMSLSEVKMRRAELQKARALQSYYEAKARRERKIKSKKYHRVLNKAKRKDFLKQFDEMVKKDPAGALEEMNKMEVARMQERMSLKHQNSGKWARSKAIMAKYDDGARKAMQQQLEVNKDLTQKLAVAVCSEDEEAEIPETLPDFVNEAPQGTDSNPWMKGKLSEDPAENGKEADDVAPQSTGIAPVTAAAAEEEEEEESDVEETEEESLLREFDSRRKMRQDSEPLQVGKEDSQMELNRNAPVLKESEDTSVPLLEGQTDQMETFEYMELLNQVESVQAETASVEPQPSSDRVPQKQKKGIELKDVLTKDANPLLVPLAPTAAATEDSDETLDQTGLIREAFAGDDVISDFVKEKKKQANADKPRVVDLTLPGWGEWGGSGLRPSLKKRRRFRVKTGPPPPRKDDRRPGVIISEKRNGSLSLHQLNSQPFPFTSPAQFESTLRAPVGRTWNTERTVKKLTKPEVLTRLGAVIEPMAREELTKDKDARAGDWSGEKIKINF